MNVTIWRCPRSEGGWQTEPEIASLQCVSRSTQAVEV